MLTTHSRTAGATEAADAEEVETFTNTESSEVRELRDQLVVLTDWWHNSRRRLNSKQMQRADKRRG